MFTPTVVVCMCILSIVPQAISPAWVRTEFAACLQKDDDVEAVKKSMGDVSGTWNMPRHVQ